MLTLHLTFLGLHFKWMLSEAKFINLILKHNGHADTEKGKILAIEKLPPRKTHFWITCYIDNRAKLWVILYLYQILCQVDVGSGPIIPPGLAGDDGKERGLRDLAVMDNRHNDEEKEKLLQDCPGQWLSSRIKIDGNQKRRGLQWLPLTERV